MEDYNNDLDIEIYNKVRNGSIRYPRNFWNDDFGDETSKKIIHYVFSDLLKWSIDEIKANATINVFKKYKLIRTLSFFQNSIYIALGEAYPELKKWGEELYIKYGSNRSSSVRRYSNNDLIANLQKRVKELNRIPKSEEMSNPGYATYAVRFGSWEKTLMKAGLIKDIYKNIDFEKNSKERVLEHLKSICVKKERMLTKKEVYELYEEGIIKEYFGSYRKLENIIENDYTKYDLIRILKDKKKALNRIPTNKDMKFPRAIVFIDKFGTWDNAIDEILE